MFRAEITSLFVGITCTLGDDSLSGTSGVEAILSLDGNDRLKGGAGDASLYGGDGEVTLLGEAGNHKLHADNDELNGDDFLFGDAGNGVLINGTPFGVAEMTGGASADSFYARVSAGPSLRATDLNFGEGDNFHLGWQPGSPHGSSSSLTPTAWPITWRATVGRRSAVAWWSITAAARSPSSARPC